MWKQNCEKYGPKIINMKKKSCRNVRLGNVRNMGRRRGCWSRVEVEEGVGGEVGPINHFLQTADNLSWKIHVFEKIQGVFLTGTPPKKLKYVKPRLGESSLT